MLSDEGRPFADHDRLRIGKACRGSRKSLSELAELLGRKQGSIQGKVERMVAAGLLLKGPPVREGKRHSYLLNRDAEPALKAAEKARRQDSGEVEPAVVRRGQRLLLIGGDEFPEVAATLRRLSVERHTEWAARVDGPGGRVLLAVSDDGPLCDEIEGTVQRADGTVSQARIDQFLDRGELASWLDAST
jgi:hypothetical protein